jgi:hypothetical protein
MRASICAQRMISSPADGPCTILADWQVRQSDGSSWRAVPPITRIFI